MQTWPTLWDARKEKWNHNVFPDNCARCLFLLQKQPKSFGQEKRQSGDRLHLDHTGLFPPWELKWIVNTKFCVLNGLWPVRRERHSKTNNNCPLCWSLPPFLNGIGKSGWEPFVFFPHFLPFSNSPVSDFCWQIWFSAKSEYLKRSLQSPLFHGIEAFGRFHKFS